jgi:hypothetical protein
MVDPVTVAGAVVIAGLKYVGQPSAELVKDLVERILGPAADVKGQELKEWLEQRSKRAEDTVYAAAGLLHEAGIEPLAVPGRILWPILQHASLQDQPELQRKWASLLANAATPGFPEILPAYDDILRQLTPLHVRSLDWMFSLGPLRDHQNTFKPVKMDDALRTLEINSASYRLLATDLHRMRLIDAEQAVLVVNESRTSHMYYGTVLLTPLGIAFITACSTPRPVQPVATSERMG